MVHKVDGLLVDDKNVTRHSVYKTHFISISLIIPFLGKVFDRKHIRKTARNLLNLISYEKQRDFYFPLWIVCDELYLPLLHFMHQQNQFNYFACHFLTLPSDSSKAIQRQSWVNLNLNYSGTPKLARDIPWSITHTYKLYIEYHVCICRFVSQQNLLP